MQLQIIYICSVRIGVFYLIYETSQYNTYTVDSRYLDLAYLE